ncbi:Stress-associated endoplasmic reticulum protein 2, partial [Myotis davidii]
RPQEEKYPVGPWLLALFVFVVCGSEKVHCPEIPVVQPSWVSSQMDNACIKSWLLLDWATGHSSPYLFLDMCSGTYLNSPCLQVNHINTGLSWRLPEHS